MFVEVLTTKNEKISVNENKVLFFGETKKGVTLILDDGTAIDLAMSYSDVISGFNHQCN
jgi:hypothetical protein